MPLPLFDVTDERNLSIKVKMHLEYIYIPLKYDMYCILENGDRLSDYLDFLILSPIRVTFM